MLDFIMWYLSFFYNDSTLMQSRQMRYIIYANYISFYGLFVAGAISLFWALISSFMHFKGGCE